MIMIVFDILHRNLCEMISKYIYAIFDVFLVSKCLFLMRFGSMNQQLLMIYDLSFIWLRRDLFAVLFVMYHFDPIFINDLMWTVDFCFFSVGGLFRCVFFSSNFSFSLSFSITLSFSVCLFLSFFSNTVSNNYCDVCMSIWCKSYCYVRTYFKWSVFFFNCLESLNVNTKCWFGHNLAHCMCIMYLRSTNCTFYSSKKNSKIETRKKEEEEKEVAEEVKKIL